MKKHRKYSFVGLLLILTTVFTLLRCHVSQEVSLRPLGELPHPADNPISAEKIALGKEFFFDKRLSIDESISCATCHKPGLAFTDGLPVSAGVLGRHSARNSPTLLNAAFLEKIMFDGEVATLEMQSIVPIQDHNEMGMEMKVLLQKLREIPEYQAAAQAIYQRDMDAWVLTRSLAAYERSLISDNSPFDQFYTGQKKNAISNSAKRGWVLFSEKLYCTSCHPAPHFTTYKPENNGLYADYGADQGRFRIHNDSAEIGKFKVPSLRNIEITDPYMHDGSISSLEEVLDHYAAGGKEHRNQHPVIKPFTLTKREKTDLINFFYALTDMSFMERL
jgi:cytochrome c peroxidase